MSIKAMVTSSAVARRSVSPVQFDEAVRLRRVGMLGRVRLQTPPVVVEHDLPVVRNTIEEPVERIRQACFQLLDRRVGINGEPGARPERGAAPRTRRGPAPTARPAGMMALALALNNDYERFEALVAGEGSAG